nr:hypothetical protein [Nitratireductor aquibiodomus]
MKRLSFWRAALGAYINEVKGHPFEWGVFDCACLLPVPSPP